MSSLIFLQALLCMNGQIINFPKHVMIIDITEEFHKHAGTSRPSYTQSNWHASGFLKTATSDLSDLTTLEVKLNDLEKSVKGGSRFDKEAQNKMITNVKEHLKLCEKNIKRLKSTQVDIRSTRQTAQKLKESILIAMELKLLKATFYFKDIHLFHTKKNNKQIAQPNSSHREIDLNKSHFLETSQAQMLQQSSTKQYKQIQKSILQISAMYKETLNVVRLQQLLVDNIEAYIDDTDQNVQSGRKNLTQLNSKEQKNRKFILKVFGILYVIVFVYLVFLL